MPFTLYLVGYMSGEKLQECTEWRKKIREYFDLNPKWHGHMCFLDPFNGQEIATIDKEGLHSSIPDQALVHRDFNCVKSADLIIANLDTFGAERPMVGSLYELAWAWLDKKPVIIITSKDYYKYHPFIKNTASFIFENVDQVLESKAINYFYQGKHSAAY